MLVFLLLLVDMLDGVEDVGIVCVVEGDFWHFSWRAYDSGYVAKSRNILTSYYDRSVPVFQLLLVSARGKTRHALIPSFFIALETLSAGVVPNCTSSRTPPFPMTQLLLNVLLPSFVAPSALSNSLF
jgi:hypothetical protein